MVDRHFEKLFKDARRTLESVERANKNRDVSDPYESKVEKTKEWRREVREVLLERLCPERKCPICRETKLKSRQWVVLAPTHIECASLVVRDVLKDKRAVCRSCFRRFFV